MVSAAGIFSKNVGFRADFPNLLYFILYFFLSPILIFNCSTLDIVYVYFVRRSGQRTFILLNAWVPISSHTHHYPCLRNFLFPPRVLSLTFFFRFLLGLLFIKIFCFNIKERKNLIVFFLVACTFLCRSNKVNPSFCGYNSCWSIATVYLLFGGVLLG